MRFDVTVTHERGYVRVRVEGESAAGRLLSLLQVLAVDCRSWPEPAVLWDLRDVQLHLSAGEQVQVAEAAARAFKRKVAILAVRSSVREAAGVRVFDDEAAAQAWLSTP
jgi:hypothetical protein